MKPKFTPGPWKSGRMDEKHVYADREHDGIGNNEANARLIAAAPELLEECKYALQRLKELQGATGYPTAHPQIELEAAIAKAEGSSNE